MSTAVDVLTAKLDIQKANPVHHRPLRIFIGYDPLETVAWHVLSHSILKRASVPVAITPLNLRGLKEIYRRPRDPKQSNEFSFTRFLVPFLSNYEGYSLFMDCDMLVRCDIKELFDIAHADYMKSVHVVKHDYTSKYMTKYLGTVQYKYPKKNWSSVMLFNNMLCKNLTLDYIHKASGLDLHQFKWTSEDRIGELGTEWNHLVSEYSPNPKAKVVHFTVGGPYFHEYEHCEFSEAWFQERADMQFCAQRDTAENRYETAASLR